MNRFDPAVSGSDWFANESLDLRGSGRVGVGLVGDYSIFGFTSPIGFAFTWEHCCTDTWPFERKVIHHTPTLGTSSTTPPAPAAPDDWWRPDQPPQPPGPRTHRMTGTNQIQ